MTVTNPTLLADLAQELLDAGAELLADTVPDRVLVSHGEPPGDCEELTVHLVRVRPRATDGIGSECSVVLVATYAVSLWRCVTAVAMEDRDDPIPEADVLSAENLALLVDGWALLKGMTRKWVEHSLPGGVPCNQVTWGTLEPKPPQGGLAGWRFEVAIDLTPNPV